MLHRSRDGGTALRSFLVTALSLLISRERRLVTVIVLLRYMVLRRESCSGQDR